jgi:hypothetical protein
MQPDRTGIQNKCFKMSLIASLVIIGFGMLTGCTAKYGRIQASPEVTQLFETQQILPDHTYYFNGFQAIPNVIVGIDNQFNLRSAGWRRLRPTPALLNQLATRMQSVFSGNPIGAWIIGPNNERIGIWYSTERQTTVRLREDNSVVIVAPQPPDMRGIP